MKENENGFVKLVKNKEVKECSFAGEFCDSILRDFNMYINMNLSIEEFADVSNEVLKIYLSDYISDEGMRYMSFNFHMKEKTKLGVITVNCKNSDLDSTAQLISNTYKGMKDKIFVRIDKYFITQLKGGILKRILGNLKS